MTEQEGRTTPHKETSAEPSGDFLQVMTTAGSREEADRIAATLVGSRLAACVQVLGPVTSSYWWEGQVQTAEEWFCIAKTARGLYSAVERAITEVHSYELPEIIGVPIVAGSDAYLRWLTDNIAPEST